jgi:hypothetical protein
VQGYAGQGLDGMPRRIGMPIAVVHRWLGSQVVLLNGVIISWMLMTSSMGIWMLGADDIAN